MAPETMRGQPICVHMSVYFNSNLDGLIRNHPSVSDRPLFLTPTSFAHLFTLQTLSVDLQFNTLSGANTKVGV